MNAIQENLEEDEEMEQIRSGENEDEFLNKMSARGKGQEQDVEVGAGKVASSNNDQDDYYPEDEYEDDRHSGLGTVNEKGETGLQKTAEEDMQQMIK